MEGEESGRTGGKRPRPGLRETSASCRAKRGPEFGGGDREWDKETEARGGVAPREIRCVTLLRTGRRSEAVRQCVSRIREKIQGKMAGQRGHQVPGTYRLAISRGKGKRWRLSRGGELECSCQSPRTVDARFLLTGTSEHHPSTTWALSIYRVYITFLGHSVSATYSSHILLTVSLESSSR
jgi:hypothetical protein